VVGLATSVNEAFLFQTDPETNRLYGNEALKDSDQLARVAREKDVTGNGPCHISHIRGYNLYIPSFCFFLPQVDLNLSLFFTMHCLIHLVEVIVVDNWT
jgi:hypothetical protein